MTDLLGELAARGEFALALVYSPVRIDARFAACLSELAARGVKVTPVPMVRSIAPYDDARALLGILRALRASGTPALVHTHSAKGGFLGRLAARLAGVPAVHTPHGLAWKAARRPTTAAVYRTLERVAATWTQCTVAVSQEEARELAETGVAGGEACAVIENAIADLHAPRTGALRRELGISRGARVVGAVGRLGRQKDPHLFVAVADELLAASPERDAHFVWVGGGEDHAEVLRRVSGSGLSGRVHFVGPRSNVHELLADFDTYLLTSRYEGLSYALLEAMRAGLPVVATAVEGAQSVLGGDGVVIPSRDPAVIARRLGDLLDDDVALRRLGDASRARFLARYQLAHMIDGVRDLYRRIATPA